MNRQFVSYPKSGRSWIRYVLHLLGLQERIHFHHDGCEFSDPTRPPLALDWPARLASRGNGGRVVYLRREPRDVMVSLFFQIKGRMSDVFDFEGDVSAFIRDEYFGAANLYEFDRQWRQLCERGLALCVTYESCHQNLEGVMREILAWYQLDVTDAALRAACAAASFDRMRAVELSGDFAEPWLRPRNGAVKTRRGVTCGYSDYLSVTDSAFLDRIFAPPAPQS